MKVTQLSYEEACLIRRRRRRKALKKRLCRTFTPTKDQLLAIAVVICTSLIILHPPCAIMDDGELKGMMFLTMLCGVYAYFHMLKMQAEKYLFYYC